jgi:hypothetical protein
MGLASYYAYGLPTFTVVVIALYLLFTGNWSRGHDPVTATKIRSRKVRVKPSMLAGSSKKRVLMRGRRPESACASASAFSVQDGARICDLSQGHPRGKLTLVPKGNLRHWFFDSWWWCEGTPDTDKELDQVSLRFFHVSGYAVSHRLHSIIFCEVVAIYGVVRSQPRSRSLRPPHRTASDNWHCVLRQIDVRSGFRHVHSR